MIKTRALALVVLGLVLSTHALQGQGRPAYRSYQLGADLQSISALAGVATSAATTIHRRPAVIQDLEWRRLYSLSQSSTPQDDPVQHIAFSFYNDQLFRLVIDYDRQRTDGLTDRDMIEAVSEAYGSPLPAGPRYTPAASSRIDAESGPPVARWGDVEYSVVLYRASYASSFRLIVTSSRLDALSRTAEAQAIQLDRREAPQRDVERQKKEAEDTRVAQEKARLANKAAFRP